FYADVMLKGKLEVTINQLNIRLCLFNGQAFRWKCRQPRLDDQQSSAQCTFRAVGVLQDLVIELTQQQPDKIDDSEQPKQNNKLSKSIAESKQGHSSNVNSSDTQVYWRLLNTEQLIASHSMQRRWNEYACVKVEHAAKGNTLKKRRIERARNAVVKSK